MGFTVEEVQGCPSAMRKFKSLALLVALFSHTQGLVAQRPQYLPPLVVSLLFLFHYSEANCGTEEQMLRSSGLIPGFSRS